MKAINEKGSKNQNVEHPPAKSFFLSSQDVQTPTVGHEDKYSDPHSLQDIRISNHPLSGIPSIAIERGSDDHVL
jgi:hypothetical protein